MTVWFPAPAVDVGSDNGVAVGVAVPDALGEVAVASGGMVPVGLLVANSVGVAVTGVALLPGTAFGSYGEGYLRLSYASSIEAIEAGLERLWRYFSELK